VRTTPRTPILRSVPLEDERPRERGEGQRLGGSGRMGIPFPKPLRTAKVTHSGGRQGSRPTDQASTQRAVDRASALTSMVGAIADGAADKQILCGYAPRASSDPLRGRAYRNLKYTLHCELILIWFALLCFIHSLTFGLMHQASKPNNTRRQRPQPSPLSFLISNLKFASNCFKI